MAETVVIRSLSTQSAGQPYAVDDSALDTAHETGADTNGVLRERISITAYNASTSIRTLYFAFTGSTETIVVQLRPQAGPVVVLDDAILPASITSGTTYFIAARADGADVFLMGIVHQFQTVEV